MPNAAALIGLTYDGTDLQDSSLLHHLVIVRGLWEPPPVRGTDTVVPSAEGAVEGERVNGMLRVELDGFIRIDPTIGDVLDAIDDYYERLAALRTLFATDRTRASLVATLPSGTAWTLSARPLSMLAPEHVPGHFASLSVELEGSGDWAIGAGASGGS